MAKAAPGFWTVWLWKLGMWGLVILFAVLYLGSVERHRGAAEGEPVVAAGGGESVVDVVTHTAVVGQEPASGEPEGHSQVEMPVSEPPGAMSAGSGRTTSGSQYPVSESVSQAEAQAFAKAVMSGSDTESADRGPALAVGSAPGQLAVDAVVSPAPVVQPSVGSQMAGIPRAASARTEQQAPESRSFVPHIGGDRVPETEVSAIPVSEDGLRVLVEQEIGVVPSAGVAASSVAFGAAPSAAPSLEPEIDVPGAAVDRSQAPVPETAAQRRARIMGEYRAMQRAAQEEMRNRWSSMGRGYPYGAYPRWGYPPALPPLGDGPTDH